MKTLYTVLLLILSNVFMTFAWYGHLKFATMKWFQSLPLIAIILISWGIAFAEYCFQVPANRIGYIGNGGPLSLIQLKVIQKYPHSVCSPYLRWPFSEQNNSDGITFWRFSCL